MIDTNKLLSRQGPSKRYTELLTEYQSMHKVSDGMFNGRSLVKFIDIIKNYLDKHECKSLIDYGCGKGLLYTEDFKKVTRSDDALQVPLTKYWGLDKLALFDPGHEEHNKLPMGLYDAAISTDVLEHVPTSDLDWVIREIFSYSQKIVFLNIACMPAIKKLSDGSNAHISLHSPYDWLQYIAEITNDFTKHYPDFAVYVFFDVLDEDDRLITEGYKIHKRINIIPLTQMDKDTNNVTVGEE